MTGRAILRLSPIALLLVAAACGGSGTKTVTVTQTVPASTSVAAQIYLVRNGKIAPVARTVPARSEADLITALVRGPTSAERAEGYTTAVPSSGDLKEDNLLGIAQVVYTVSQFRPSGIYCGVLGIQCHKRSDLEDETPIILVESPLPFAHVTSPLHATGTANAFEATFQYELRDADGKVLAKHFVTATSGNGVRGTFDFTAEFSVPSQQQGKLVVYENSAANGQRIHQSEIPLTLEP